MKLITRDSVYAMKALCFMAERVGKILSVNEIVFETKVPRNFLRKILQILSKKKIIKSYKGKDGGFLFLKSPDSISFIDIMEIFQGKFALTEHKLGRDKCPRIKRCDLKKKLDKIEKSIAGDLRLITVASMLGK